jgi:hypothetical protein
MTATAYELNPDEVLALTADLPERDRLAYLLAIRRLRPAPWPAFAGTTSLRIV